MSNNSNDSFIDHFRSYTNVIINISDYTYLFKAINCLDTKKTESQNEDILSTIAIIIISCLMLLAILKTILIYLSYYFIVIPKALYTIFKAIIISKCQIRLQLILTKIGKSALSHLQTFYSYNFYSYTEPISGVILMLLYLVFIFASMMMALMYFTNPQFESDSIPRNVLYIVGFLPQLFLQIYLPFYYYKRKGIKFSLFFTTSFTFWFFALGLIAYILNQKRYKANNNRLIYILFSIILHLFILLAQILAIRKMYRYSLNSIINLIII